MTALGAAAAARAVPNFLLFPAPPQTVSPRWWHEFRTEVPRYAGSRTRTTARVNGHRLLAGVGSGTCTIRSRAPRANEVAAPLAQNSLRGEEYVEGCGRG